MTFQILWVGGWVGGWMGDYLEELEDVAVACFCPSLPIRTFGSLGDLGGWVGGRVGGLIELFIG